MEYIDSIKYIPEFHVHIPDNCYIYTSVFPFHITLYGYHVKYILVYMWWKHFILVLIPWDHIVICDTLGFHVQISTISSVTCILEFKCKHILCDQNDVHFLLPYQSALVTYKSSIEFFSWNFWSLSHHHQTQTDWSTVIDFEKQTLEFYQ